MFLIWIDSQSSDLIWSSQWVVHDCVDKLICIAGNLKHFLVFWIIETESWRWQKNLFLSFLLNFFLLLLFPFSTILYLYSLSWRREFADRARSLEHLSGIVTDLFVDWHRLHGKDSRSKIPDLQRVINSCADDFNRLLEAFFTLPGGNNQNSHNYINGSSPKNSKGYWKKIN